MKIKPSFLSQIDQVRQQKPDLGLSIERALNGPSGKGPTKRFKEVVFLATRNVWRPIEELLFRADYAEPKPENVTQSLAAIKQVIYENLRPKFAKLAASLSEGNRIVVGYQNRLWQAEKSTELMALINEVLFIFAKQQLKDEIQ